MWSACFVLSLTKTVNKGTFLQHVFISKNVGTNHCELIQWNINKKLQYSHFAKHFSLITIATFTNQRLMICLPVVFSVHVVH